MVDRDLGIFGEKRERNKKKQVSILSKEVRDRVDDEQLVGLCLSRFYENITIEGLDVSKIRVGQRLQVGETIQEVTIIGKECFKECKLVKNEEKCDLSKNVIFTTMVEGGFIAIDDEVRVLG